MDCELNERHELPQLLWLMPKTHAVVMDSTSVHQPHRQCESGKSIAEIRCNETVRRNQENWKEKRNHNKIFITLRAAYAFIWFRKHILSEVRNVGYLLLFKLISEIMKRMEIRGSHPASRVQLSSHKSHSIKCISCVCHCEDFTFFHLGRFTWRRKKNAQLICKQNSLRQWRVKNMPNVKLVVPNQYENLFKF